MGRRARKPAAAYSLIEVMIATAILLGSTIILAQLAGVGREHAWRADDATQAQVLCQNKMNELLAGVTPLEAVEDEPLGMTASTPADLSATPTEDPAANWNHTVLIEPLDELDLVSVTVIVTEVESDLERARRTDRQPRSFRLVRWMQQSAMSAGRDSFELPNRLGEGLESSP